MIPKHMEYRARLIVLACVGVVILSSLVGLLWMSQYAVK
jgi:hypothetical protein